MEITKLDGRNLNIKHLKLVVQAVQAGQSPEQSDCLLGMTRAAFGIQCGRMASTPGEKAVWSPTKARHTPRCPVVGKNPLQLKLEFALWTREMIRDLIKRQFGISMSVVSVGRLFGKAGSDLPRPAFLEHMSRTRMRLINGWRRNIQGLLRLQNRACFGIFC